jgi:hypothetical protein
MKRAESPVRYLDSCRHNLWSGVDTTLDATAHSQSCNQDNRVGGEYARFGMRYMTWRKTEVSIFLVLIAFCLWLACEAEACGIKRS